MRPMNSVSVSTFITFLSLTALSLARALPDHKVIDFLRDLTDATATSCQDECLGGFFHESIKPPGEADNHAQEVHVADDWLRRGSPFLEKLHAHENVPKKGNIACMPLSKRTKTTP
jgi:hypothetical protein